MMTHKKHIKDSKLSTGRTRDKRRDNRRDNLAMIQGKTLVLVATYKWQRRFDT